MKPHSASSRTRTPARRSTRSASRLKRKYADTDTEEEGSSKANDNTNDDDVDSTSHSVFEEFDCLDHDNNRPVGVHTKSDDDQDYKSSASPGKGPPIRLRKARRKTNSTATSSLSRKTGTSPPVFWCEVYFDAEQRWLTLDPTRALVDDPKAMEPAPSNAENVMSYVVAFDEGGF
jgi:hypothetical protein